jgi:hypothetical protein
MTDVLEFSKFHMYGDDLQIYHSRPRDLLSVVRRGVPNLPYKISKMCLLEELWDPSPPLAIISTVVIIDPLFGLMFARCTVIVFLKRPRFNPNE